MGYTPKLGIPYEVASFNHRSTLSATNKSKRVIEKLYCNKPIEKNTFWFM